MAQWRSQHPCYSLGGRGMSTEKRFSKTKIRVKGPLMEKGLIERLGSNHHESEKLVPIGGVEGLSGVDRKERPPMW